MKIVYFLLLLLTVKSFGQSVENQYFPVCLNSSIFHYDNKRVDVGANINNYGLNFKLASLKNESIFLLSVQKNSLNSVFNSKYSKYEALFGNKNLIASSPVNLIYTEIGYGFKLDFNRSTANVIFGLGQQFIETNTRVFIQLDYGMESRLINTGVILRTNYTRVNNLNLIIMEPGIQGKFKYKNFRLFNQLALSFPIRKYERYAEVVYSFGVEYVIRRKD